MKDRNGWLYAFWILLVTVLILCLAAGLISWAGTDAEESAQGKESDEEPSDDGGDEDKEDENDTAIVIIPSESFTFNDETFDGIFGADNFTDANDILHDGITVTEITDDATGAVSVVIDGAVANVMSEAQKAAFDASYLSDEDVIRFYVALEIAVQPGGTVTYTLSNGKTDTVTNTESEVQYIVIVEEVLNPSGQVLMIS